MALVQSLEKILSLHNAEDRVDWLGVGYKELFMPTTEDGKPRIDIKSLHIWLAESIC